MSFSWALFMEYLKLLQKLIAAVFSGLIITIQYFSLKIYQSHECNIFNKKTRCCEEKESSFIFVIKLEISSRFRLKYVN